MRICHLNVWAIISQHFLLSIEISRAFESSDGEEEGMNIQGVEEDVDEEEMLRQAIALSLEDV